MDDELTTGGETPPADTASTPAPEPPKRRRGRPPGSTARTTRVVTMTLTVSGSADGDWQAELKQGTTWVARGLPVTASAVSAAAAARAPIVPCGRVRAASGWGSPSPSSS